MSMAYAEVIGDPIAQSKSPAIHGYWIDRLGLDAQYRACHVTAAGLEAYIASRRDDPDWRGCNITMPHKQAVIPFLDRLEIGAELIGAVNTVTRRHNGALIGTSTDGAGFLEPLKAHLAQKHLFRMARVLGTGGAARAIVAALAEQGFTIVLAGRNPAKAQAILDEIDPEGQHHAVDIAHFATFTDFAFDDRQGCFDLLVNASPLGMAGQAELAFDMSHVPPGCVVYDIVTHPLDTPLLKSARAAGFETLDGLNMLIGQAAAAFKKFFGVAPPREDGDAALRKILAQ
ncbi:shikimate dehydrogenase [Alteraurantiacibacter aestuarii]|uniref:Shikimate dehydrogenase (NADP(+)) n=1 Tax=Alteraurantiacibacter aestuarii TaxID=650004 RepID=A0A844ZP54_9SPHN|nr:shikimate dehydrogenase [Alteraurantiacibacter aestuarii]MXO88597.1 shikimate dehydrogenase [Alteraurantiacibacter aestuarii]